MSTRLGFASWQLRLSSACVQASVSHLDGARSQVLMPACAGSAAETDRKAIETLQEAYGPDYKMVGVRSREVLLNAGNIHCITQQWVKGG